MVVDDFRITCARKCLCYTNVAVLSSDILKPLIDRIFFFHLLVLLKLTIGFLTAKLFTFVMSSFICDRSFSFVWLA